jgi:hypothetical protein
MSTEPPPARSLGEQITGALPGQRQHLRGAAGRVETCGDAAQRRLAPAVSGYQQDGAGTGLIRADAAVPIAGEQAHTEHDHRHDQDAGHTEQQQAPSRRHPFIMPRGPPVPPSSRRRR